MTQKVKAIAGDWRITVGGQRNYHEKVKQIEGIKLDVFFKFCCSKYNRGQIYGKCLLDMASGYIGIWICYSLLWETLQTHRKPLEPLRYLMTIYCGTCTN